MSSARYSGTFAPSARASRTVFSRPSASRSVRYSSAPSAASFSAVARPIPLAAPVMKQRLPEKPLPGAMAVSIPSRLSATPDRVQPQPLDDVDGARGVLATADEGAVVRQRHGGHRRQRPHEGGQIVGDRLCIGVLFEERDELVYDAVVEVVH